MMMVEAKGMADAKRTGPARDRYPAPSARPSAGSRSLGLVPVFPVVALVAGLVVAGPAGPAAAQTRSDDVRDVTVAVDIRTANINATNQRYLVNLEDCRDLAAEFDDEIQFTWRFTRTPPTDTQYTVKVIHRGQTCNTRSLAREATDECDVIVQQQPLSGTRLDLRLTWQEITGDTASATCEGRTDIHDVTLVFDSLRPRTGTGTGNEEDENIDFDQVRFEFRTTRPSAPTGVSARGGESTLHVSWNTVTNARSYDVFYSTSPLEVGTRPEDMTASFRNATGSSTMLDEGIQRDLTYYVAIATLDEQNNQSLLSEVVTVTTQQVTDFYEYYRQLGGADTGCASVPARPGGVGGPVVFGLLWLCWRAARRRAGGSRGEGARAPRVGVALLALAAILFAAAPEVVAEEELQSPITGEFELKLGDYHPQIDTEFSGPGPWETMFGSGGALYVEGEYSHYLWREYGAVAIGFGVGYLTKSGPGFNADGSESVDETTFQMVPLRLSLVYRFDKPARSWSIPLVPYVKLGLSAYIWWIRSAAGIATYRDPVTGQLDEGRDVTFGWHFAAGLQFLLDVLAPSMSRTFDASAGVNNTYLFAEFLYADVDDFGSDTSIRLGDSTFLFGLAFEF
jgi:hypothetical protein